MSHIIEFMKCKGQPFEVFISDTNYIEWCKNQSGLLRWYPILSKLLEDHLPMSYNPEPTKTINPIQ